MALTPKRGWIFLTVMRFIVGLGVGGFFAVDMLLHDFVPASRRGWISGASMSLLAGGPSAAGLCSASLGTIVGWRGLIAPKLREVAS
jgi:putative MFS transporter